MSELIQMENPQQTQADIRANTPEKDLADALHDSESGVTLDEAVDRTENTDSAKSPSTKEIDTPSPPIVYPEDIMGSKVFELKQISDNPVIAPEAPPNNTVAFVNPEAEATVDVSTREDSSTTKIKTSDTEALADTEALTLEALEEEGEAIIARKRAEEAELASTTIVHTNSGHFIEDYSDRSGASSPPRDGKDELRIEESLAPGSRSINIANNKGGETMSPQQATSELNTTRQEPTIADIAITEAKLGEIAPESDTRETVAEPEVSQDNQVVSSLAEGGTTAQIPETPTPSPTQEDLETSPASEVHEQAPAHENPPVNEPIVEARVADLVAEPVAPAPPIEEIRSEVMTPEPPVEQSASEKLSQIDNGPGEFSDIDFNKMSKESDDAVYGLSSGMRKVQEKIDNQFDKAGAPQVMSDTRGNPQGIAEAVMPVTPDEQAWQNKKNETNLENINKINSMLGNSGESADLPSPEELVAEGGVYKSGTEEGAVETGASEEPQILAEAEPDLKELVIEAGESTEKIAEDHDKYLEDLRNKATERLTNMVNQGETINAKIQELNELISKIDSMRQKLQFLKISRNLPDNAEASKEEAA